MDTISLQIRRLKSPDKNRRYDACEELRVADRITPAALEALCVAMSDPDPLVAEAARHAVAAHSDPVPKTSHKPIAAPPAMPDWDLPRWRPTPRNVLATIGFILASYLFIRAVWFRVDCQTNGCFMRFEDLVDIALSGVVAGLTLLGGRLYALMAIFLMFFGIVFTLFTYGSSAVLALVFLIPSFLTLALATLVYRRRSKSSPSGGTLT